MSAPRLLPIEDALALIREHVPTLPEQRVPLAEALGLELREDVVADMDQPPFDRSAMDGYAVTGDGTDFVIVGELQPGDTPSVSLSEGQALRVFTGAQIPQGATRVIMQELTEVNGTKLHETERASANFIRRKGEDAAKGKVLIKSGSQIDSIEAAMMASVGVTQPLVLPRPKAVHFTTGNELVPPEQTPALNQIRDSNSTLIAALLHDSGTQLLHQSRLRDDLDLSLAMAQQVEEQHDYDLLLVSGGASVGSYDIGKPLLERLGYTIHFTKLDLRPGKPLVFATRKKGARTQVAFILPGNPVSHYVCYTLFVYAALQQLEDHLTCWDHNWPFDFSAHQLSEDFIYKPSDRLTLWPAQDFFIDSQPHVRALPWKSSGDLQALLYPMTGFIRIRSDQEVIPKGTLVDYVFLDLTNYRRFF